MSFYLKLILIMSFVGQSIAVACVDTIAGHHDARRTVFNNSSYEGALKEKAPEINNHSGSIRDILDNESRVDTNRQATIDEKEKILKAVMAERFIAKKMQMTLGGATTPDVNPYAKTGLDPALVGHFKVLELTWNWADEMADSVLQEMSSRDYTVDQTTQDRFNGLAVEVSRLLSVDASTYVTWFCEVFGGHFVGLVSPDVSMIAEGLNHQCMSDNPVDIVVGKYALKSILELANHPLALHAAHLLMNLSDDFKGGEKEKYRRIAMDAFRKIAGNDDHAGVAMWLIDSEVATGEDKEIGVNVLRKIAHNNDSEDQAYVAKLLMRARNANAKKTGMDALREIAKNDGHKHQSYAAYVLIRSEDAAAEDKEIAMIALRNILQSDDHKDEYYAAYSLIHSEVATADDKEIGMKALRKIVQIDGHEYQLSAATRLIDSEDPADKEIAMDTFRKIEGNKDHKYQFDAAYWLERELKLLEKAASQAELSNTTASSMGGS